MMVSTGWRNSGGTNTLEISFIMMLSKVLDTMRPRSKSQTLKRRLSPALSLACELGICP